MASFHMLTNVLILHVSFAENGLHGVRFFTIPFAELREILHDYTKYSEIRTLSSAIRSIEVPPEYQRTPVSETRTNGRVSFVSLSLISRLHSWVVNLYV